MRYPILSIMGFGIVLLFSSAALAFNPLLMFDPDFLEHVLVIVPIIASILMGTTEGVLTMRVLKPDNVSKLFYILTYMFASLIGILISILVMGVLFFAVGEKLQESDNPVFIWSSIGYFAAVFIYLGWDQRRREIVKMWGKEQARYVPIKQILCVTTVISYGILYGYYYWTLVY